jgi:hypothetical protein
MDLRLITDFRNAPCVDNCTFCNCLDFPLL